jgi:secreted protein with Ig-like and vWFA domain
MNGDNHHTGPEPWSDPAHEARVVAWVLGEASEFEIADLQRLLAESPELAAFKRRIEAVHGLLGEAAKPDAEPWSMASERRAALTAVIGSAPAAAPARASVATRRAARHMVFMVAACVAGTLVVGPQDSVRTTLEAYREDLSIRVPSASEGEGKAAQMMKGMRSADSSIAASDIDGILEESSAPAAAAKPAAPSSAISGVIASAAAEPMSIPVPDIDVPTPPEDFGNTADFGEGWGGAVGGELAEGKNGKAQEQGIEGNLQLGNQAGPVFRGYDLKDSLPAADDRSDQASSPPPAEFEGSVGYGRPIQAGGSGGGGPVDGFAAPPAEGEKQLAAEDSRQNGVVTRDAQGVRSAPRAAAATNAEPAPRLATAQGLEDLGKLDDAKLEAENTLRQDPHNQEARQQLERIAAKNSDYYRAAYDQTRAETLADVDRVWELSVPKDGQKAGEPAEAGKPETDVPSVGDIPQTGKLFANEGREGEPTPAAPAMAKPAERPAVLLDETVAAQEPVSTFSLNVSDASFQLAAAAVARGERPEPNSVRVEEFYNAFDYGDPAPAPGDKVAISVEQSAHPFAQERNLVRVAMKTASVGRAGGQPLRLTVLVDTSGSMEREDRAATVQRAFGSLAKLLGPDDVVSVVGFARQPRLLADRVSGDKAGGLAEVVKRTPAEGGTNLEEALKLAGQLATRQFTAKAQNRIVLITDGAANLGDAVPEQLAVLITEFRQRGIAFDACGVGSAKTGDEMLESLTRRGDGRYYHLARAEDADANFAQKLAGAFRPAAENVKVQVHFNPERVGRYRLIGFEKHRLAEKDFHNDKVDAAELAADEAGVALYEVEVLPQGTGEIGAVAVSFRDTASGQMVERSQALRFEASVPGFDQAPASLQLAGTAAMVGEFLRGGAPAARVEFSTLAPVANALRGAYANDGRVATLLEMLARLSQ